MPQITVAPIDHRDVRVAERLHAIQMAAYAQEARLLEARHFPPLDRTVADVQASRERFLGAFWETELVGTVSVEDGAGCTELVICSLTVAPDCQRRGVGRALLGRLNFPQGRLNLERGRLSLERSRLNVSSSSSAPGRHSRGGKIASTANRNPGKLTDLTVSPGPYRASST